MELEFKPVSPKIVVILIREQVCFFINFIISIYLSCAFQNSPNFIHLYLTKVVYIFAIFNILITDEAALGFEILSYKIILGPASVNTIIPCKIFLKANSYSRVVQEFLHCLLARLKIRKE